MVDGEVTNKHIFPKENTNAENYLPEIGLNSKKPSNNTNQELGSQTYER
jgi:hypothetical protein